MSGCSGCGGETIAEVMAELMPHAGTAAPPTGDKRLQLQPSPRLPWRPLAPDVEARLDRVLRSWMGTPYAASQRVKQGGVDCRHLCVAILDELFGIKDPTFLPPMPQDSGVHSGRAGFETVRAIRKVYPATVVRDETIEPGDVLVTRGELQAGAERRLGHVMIAGTRPMTAVHATPAAGVHLTSVRNVVRVYRPRGKKGWVR